MTETPTRSNNVGRRQCEQQPPRNGFVLLEAIFALALLSFGLLALMGWLQSSMQNQRQQLAREQAMRLAQNLSEAMQLNARHASAYAQSWGASNATKTLAIDCTRQACSGAQLALWDVQRWQQQVQTDLPQGDAAVFDATQGWWGIVLAWQDARMGLRTDTSGRTPACPDQKSCWRLWVRLAP